MKKDEIFRIGVGAIIHNNKGEVLLGLRGPKARDQHYKWELMGGLLEFGETPEQAVEREILEEGDIKVKAVDVIGTNMHLSDDKTESWVGMTWLCEFISGTPKVTEFDRVIDHKWLTLTDALKEDLTPMTRLQLEQYKAWLKRNNKA